MSKDLLTAGDIWKCPLLLLLRKNWPVAPAVLQRFEIILEKICACFAHMFWFRNKNCSRWCALQLHSSLFFWGFGFLSGYLMVHWGRMRILGMTSTKWLVPGNGYKQVMHMQGRCKNDKLKKNQARCICDSDSFACPPRQRRGDTEFRCWRGNFSRGSRSQKQAP